MLFFTFKKKDMGSVATSPPDIKTIKAMSNESLKIDLGKTYMGNLVAWMKRNPNDLSYREFSILDNRYLILSKDQASDLLDQNDNIIEKIEGKWLFDVKWIDEGAATDTQRTVFRGIILFQKKLTNSRRHS